MLCVSWDTVSYITTEICNLSHWHSSSATRACMTCISDYIILFSDGLITHPCPIFKKILSKKDWTTETDILAQRGFVGFEFKVHFGRITCIAKGPWLHDDVIKWKHFPRCWPFVRGIHQSPVNPPRKGQWRGALMFSLICSWINVWVNNREVGDLSPHRAHYDVIVMLW